MRLMRFLAAAASIPRQMRASHAPFTRERSRITRSRFA
jgi:hypothetical protein